MTQDFATAAEEGTFRSTAGLKIFFRAWRPTGTARAVIVIVPGFNSHSGYYGWVAERGRATPHLGPRRLRRRSAGPREVGWRTFLRRRVRRLPERCRRPGSSCTVARRGPAGVRVGPQRRGRARVPV